MTKAIPTFTPPSDLPLTSGKTAFALLATVDRLKQMAAEAADTPLLGDEPVHPDHQLLDLCGDLLHMMKRRKDLRELQFDHPLQQDRHALFGQINSLLSKARKLRAATPAGIYAKVLVIRASESGAPMLAVSLAHDLVDVPALRASIWPGVGENVHD